MLGPPSTHLRSCYTLREVVTLFWHHVQGLQAESLQALQVMQKGGGSPPKAINRSWGLGGRKPH
jgi:hypothetical protein